MKRTLSLLLILSLMLCLAACGTSADATAQSAAAQAAEAAPEKPADSAANDPAVSEVSAAVTETKLLHEVYEQPSGELASMELDGLYTGEPMPASLGDKTVKAGETWTIEGNTVVDKLELEEGAVVEADAPVIVFFTESATVKNGDVIGQVQFVSAYDEVVAVVHTNDTHGFLQLEPYVGGLKNQLMASGNYSAVLAVSAGDVYAGGYAAAHVYEGEYIPYIMSGVYDYMTWGNNDAGVTEKGIQSYMLALLGQSEGLETLISNQNASEAIDIASYAASYEPAVGSAEMAELYPALTLNDDGTLNFDALDLESDDLATGDNVLPDGAIVETLKGTKLGIIGESTQGGSITDAYFSGGFSTIDTAQTMADALTDEGADAVILLGHIGWFGPDSSEAASNDTNSGRVAAQTTGIDAIIDGHTHSVINDGEGYLFAGVGDQPLVNQASCKGEAIGILYLYLNQGEVVAKDGVNLVPNEDGTITGIQPDAEVQAAVDRCLDRLAADGYTEVWGTSDVYLNASRLSENNEGGGVRANETNLGDLVADAIVYTAQQLYPEGNVQIALYPGFWVRASVAAGDITLVDALSVFANPLKIYHIDYTAAELVSEMTSSCAKLGEESNFMYQVSGLTCTYDPATKAVTTLTVGDELIYDHGEYLVGEDWTVGCAAEVGGGNMTIPDGGTELVSSNSEMAQYFCEFLKNAEYTIYPNEPCPAGRVIPAA